MSKYCSKTMKETQKVIIDFMEKSNINNNSNVKDSYNCYMDYEPKLVKKK